MDRFDIEMVEMVDRKIIIRLKDRVCRNADELIQSPILREFINRSLGDLIKRNSKLLQVFDHKPLLEEDVDLLLQTFYYLIRLPSDLVPCIIPGSRQFFRNKSLFNELIEYFYNKWRSFQRFIICDSIGDNLDKRPYHTFNQTIESLTHLVRSVYRDLQENTTGLHPRIYRQVPAGAEVAAIAVPKNIPYPQEWAEKVNAISIIRQILIYPPIIFHTPVNKRTGSFERTNQNLLNEYEIDAQQWLCYPARVGELVILVYFSLRFYELGFSLCNLFELASDSDLERKPDAVLFFGMTAGYIQPVNGCSTVFYHDFDEDIIVGGIPDEERYGYFGYLKKMILTLHNVCMMHKSRLPFHGAMFNLKLKGQENKTILVIGDTGAGKSETLEAMRGLEEEVEDIEIIADDMGSLAINDAHQVIGYGTEIGAFVRLDDLQPGYAFGQMDRAILLNAHQTNARVVLPVTTLEAVVKGFRVGFILYANNYEEVDDAHPVIERFFSLEDALAVFREGKAMSKGTTTSTGITKTYFVNVFGPTQYIPLHEELAKSTFQACLENGVFIGQLRTQLGIPGKERSGPEASARALVEMLKADVS